MNLDEPKFALRRSEWPLNGSRNAASCDCQVQLKQAEAAENGSSDGRKEICVSTDLE